MVGRYRRVLVNPFQFYLGAAWAADTGAVLSEGFVNFLLGDPQIRKPGLRFRQFSVRRHPKFRNQDYCFVNFLLIPPRDTPNLENQISSFVNFLVVKLSLISGFVTHFWVNDSFLGCTVSNIVIFIAMFDN